MKKVNNPNDVPKKKHYVIITYNTERYQSVYGKGYYAGTMTHTRDFIEQYVTEDKQDWLDTIERFSISNERFVAFEAVKLVEVVKKVEINR